MTAFQAVDKGSIPLSRTESVSKHICMSKLTKILKAVRSTEVESGSRVRFLVTYFLTRCMNFSLRRIPHLGQILKKTFFLFPRNAFVIKNSIGRWMVLPFDDTATISAEYFEQDLVPWLHKASKRRIFLDIGSNIGRYAIMAGNILHYSKVLAIEANPTTFALLRQNIKLNDLEDKIVAEHVAVGDKDGKVFIQADSHHLGGGNVIGDDASKRSMENVCEVRLTTVDAIMKKNSLVASDVDFIKMDVEGMEGDVLRGMKQTLAAMEPGSLLMIEISDLDHSEAYKILTESRFERLDCKANDFLFVKK